MKDVLIWAILILMSIAYGCGLSLLHALAVKRRQEMLDEFDARLGEINGEHDAKLKEIERQHEQAMRAIAEKYKIDEWQDVANRIARDMREAMGGASPPKKIRIDLDVEHEQPRVVARKAN